MARFYGGQHVAQVYLIRHLRFGVLTDCAYCERPTLEEMRATCELRGLEFREELLRVVELPVVSALDHRAEGLSTLDEWEPPPMPTLSHPMIEAYPDPKDPAEVRYRVKVSGVGTVTNPEG